MLGEHTRRQVHDGRNRRMQVFWLEKRRLSLYPDWVVSDGELR